MCFTQDPTSILQDPKVTTYIYSSGESQNLFQKNLVSSEVVDQMMTIQDDLADQSAMQNVTSD